MDWIRVMVAGPYNLAYLAAFGVGIVYAASVGRRNGWPSLPWLTTIAACAAGGIAGSKLFHFDLSLAAAGEKTILGGIVGGALALILTGYFLRTDRSALDRLVPALAAGFALGRIGCFLAGCCFGRPTGLPWGVVYGPGTDAYEHQLASGLIESSAAGTTPAHPTQLYEAVLALLLVWAARHGGIPVRRTGSRFLLFASGFGIMRFAVEPFRGAAIPVHGLTPVQWTLAATVAALLLLLFWRERAPTRADGAVVQAPAPERALLILLAILALGAFGAGWLTPLERIALLATSAPALLLTGALWIRRYALAPAPALVAMALFLQVPPQDSRQEGSHVFVGGSAMTGKYVETCGGAHRYTVGGASLGYKHVTGPAESFTVRGQIFAGRDAPDDPLAGPTERVFGFAMAGQVDRRYLGLGVGATGGHLIWDGDREGILPVARVRLGSLSSVFIEGRLFDHEPAAVPAPGLQIGLGYGLGASGSLLRAGISDAGFYGGATIATAAGFEVEPFVALGEADVYQVGVALRQRIGARR